MVSKIAENTPRGETVVIINWKSYARDNDLSCDARGKRWKSLWSLIKSAKFRVMCYFKNWLSLFPMGTVLILRKLKRDFHRPVFGIFGPQTPLWLLVTSVRLRIDPFPSPFSRIFRESHDSPISPRAKDFLSGRARQGRPTGNPVQLAREFQSCAMINCHNQPST